MKYFILLLFVTIISINANSQSAKIDPMIIDTDCAADDLRAISLLLSIDEIDILGITVSDGGLSPDEGLSRVKSLLRNAKLSDIKTAKGRVSKNEPPVWRAIAEKMFWGQTDSISTRDSPEAVALIKEEIPGSAEKVILVCLGPLTNIAEALKEMPELKRKIKKVIWYMDAYNKKKGFNYQYDQQAAEFVLNSGITIDIISNLQKKESVFDEELLHTTAEINNRFSSAIYKAHQPPEIMQKVKEQHFGLWDDLVPVYFLYPELFDMLPDKDTPRCSYTTEYSAEAVKNKFIDILSGNYAIEKNIVFEKFPVDALHYRYDVQQIAEHTIEKYGLEEWRICVLANEIHRHLGIYSLVGVKMGLKACEVLNADRDRIKVYSYAGNYPPISCLNDGLQISTGATVGQGTIYIVNDPEKRPEATFEYNGKYINVNIKNQYKEQIALDIGNAILKYGNLTDGYWKLIRKLSIKYWAEWDRNQIFEITEVEKVPVNK